MKWQIPAKTFLLGEYAALAGSASIILTTTPCFEFTLVENQQGIQGVHTNSPAGRWWQCKQMLQGATWFDPYNNRGGVGASSAQFIGVYLATHHLLCSNANLRDLFINYIKLAWDGEGCKPSGYDVLAQTQNCCVYIDRQHNVLKSYNWNFPDIAFILLHSGVKLATHQHLKSITLLPEVNQLTAITQQAQQAFIDADSNTLIKMVNNYHQQLRHLNLVAPHSLRQIHLLQKQSDVLAIKGCGALGIDVILLIVPQATLIQKIHTLTIDGWVILATSDDLYTGAALLHNTQ